MNKLCTVLAEGKWTFDTRFSIVFWGLLQFKYVIETYVLISVVMKYLRDSNIKTTSWEFIILSRRVFDDRVPTRHRTSVIIDKLN